MLSVRIEHLFLFSQEFSYGLGFMAWRDIVHENKVSFGKPVLQLR